MDYQKVEFHSLTIYAAGNSTILVEGTYVFMLSKPPKIYIFRFSIGTKNPDRAEK
jgi:hypothetical protein